MGSRSHKDMHALKTLINSYRLHIPVSYLSVVEVFINLLLSDPSFEFEALCLEGFEGSTHFV